MRSLGAAMSCEDNFLSIAIRGVSANRFPVCDTRRNGSRNRIAIGSCACNAGQVRYAWLSRKAGGSADRQVESGSVMKQMLKAAACLVALTLACVGIPAQEHAAAGNDETRTARRMEQLRANPPALHAFLLRMPKGADLHMHLSGAVYAETFLHDAAEDNLCVDTSRLAFVPNRGLTKSLPPHAVCGDDAVPAANALTDQKLYDALVDSFSMRAFVPSAGKNGHDQFFATFARYGGLAKSHGGEWVDEVARRAAAQNEQYLELMHTPDFSIAARLAAQSAWDGNLPRTRDTLLAGGLRDNIPGARAEFEALDGGRKAREHCGTPQATPACGVEVRYIYQVLRSNEPARVFAQTLLGFELASVDPRVVGINFVQPEDTYLAMSQYHAQMAMLHYLRSVYPKVHLSLHAGELSPGMVPPEGLRFHIHDAVLEAGAERIGHGVDVLYESNAAALLRDMAQRHVMVEVNLTSNDVILGIRGKDHSLTSYLAAGVPVALSTDDEGVSRIDLTHEYERAALEQGLTYTQLKRSARTSLEHSFLPGESLWAAPDNFTAMRAECAGKAAKAGASCQALLAGSERARQQWELESRFHAFEAETAQTSLSHEGAGR